MNPILPIIRLVLKILSFILYAITICAAYGGYVSPDIWAFPSVLTLGLTILAGLTFAAGICWLATRHLFMAGFAAATIAICWSPISAVSPLGRSKSPEPGERTFTLMSYNILHGIDLEQPDSRQNRGFSYIARISPDIVCLQECSSENEIMGINPQLADSLLRQYPYRIFDVESGNAVMSRYPVRNLHSAITNESGGGAFAIYRIQMPGDKSLTVINAHLTSYCLTEQERDVVTDIRGVRSARRSLGEFKGSIMDKLKVSFRQRAADARELRAAIDRIEGPLVVCGDFNDVPASYSLRTVMGDDMNDAYRETNFGPTATYNRHRLFFHIDQILYRGPMRALDVEKGKQKNSDHYPLTATFAFTSTNNQ